MWRSVSYDVKKVSSQPSRRGRRASHTSNWLEPVLDTDSKLPVSNKQVAKLVKNLRHTACALRSNSVLPFEKPLQFVERFVRNFLDFHLRQATCEREKDSSITEDPYQKNLPLPSIRLIALGIGPFDRQQGQQQNLAGFLQMSAFIAMRDACQRVIDSFSIESAPSFSVSTGATLDANGAIEGAATPSPKQPQTKPHQHVHGKNTDTILFHASFYDPACGPLHSLCCQRLAIEVEATNTQGVYRPDHGRDLVIVFAPHCPWAMLHNLFVANWPSPAAVGDFSGPPAVPLRQVLLLANGLERAPFAAAEPSASGLWSLGHGGLRGCLAIHPLRAKRKGRRPTPRARFGDSDLVEEATEASLGAGPRSLLDAFSDLALMSVREELSDAEVVARLLPGTRSLKPLAQFQEMH